MHSSALLQMPRIVSFYLSTLRHEFQLGKRKGHIYTPCLICHLVLSSRMFLSSRLPSLLQATETSRSEPLTSLGPQPLPQGRAHRSEQAPAFPRPWPEALLTDPLSPCFSPDTSAPVSHLDPQPRTCQWASAPDTQASGSSLNLQSLWLLLFSGSRQPPPQVTLESLAPDLCPSLPPWHLVACSPLGAPCRP